MSRIGFKKKSHWEIEEVEMRAVLLPLLLSVLATKVIYNTASQFSKASDDDKLLVFKKGDCLGFINRDTFVTATQCPMENPIKSFSGDPRPIRRVIYNREDDDDINRAGRNMKNESLAKINVHLPPTGFRVYSSQEEFVCFGFRNNGGKLEYIELKRLSQEECKSAYKAKGLVSPDVKHVTCASAATDVQLTPGSPLTVKHE